MMKLSELAKAIGAEFRGGGDPEVGRVAGLQEAQSGDITFVTNRKYAAGLATTKAAAVILKAPLEGNPLPAIYAPSPSGAATAAAAALGMERPRPTAGISAKASVHPSANVSKNATLMDYAVVDAGAVVGDGATLYPFTYVGQNARVGAGSTLSPGVVVMDSCTVGERTVIHSNTVIGSDGFGFDLDPAANTKVPQLGIVEVGDDVEIGACVTIDRARFDKTSIGAGTKIDNLVQIGHNVRIGKQSIIISQAGIAGSTQIGDQVILAARVGVNGHIEITDRVLIAACSIVKDSITESGRYGGAPAQKVGQWHRHVAALSRIEAMQDELAALREQVAALQKQMAAAST